MKSLLALAAVAALFAGCASSNKEAPPPYGKPYAADGKPVDRAQVKDPVCGMMIDSDKATEYSFKDVNYYFCSDKCEETFEKSPETYLKKATTK